MADGERLGHGNATGAVDVVARAREARPLYTRTASRDPRESVRVTILRTLDLWLRDSRHARPMTAEEQTRHEVKKASASMGAYLDELPSRAIDVLDFGCGWGGETIWLASQVRSVVGVDVDRSSIEQARRALRAAALDNCRFVAMSEGRIPLPDATIDAVFSTDTFEHVMDLGLAFREIARVLRPGGSLVTRFGPLFYSPYGYHMQWACQVPYAHLLFGLDAVMALRRERTGQLLEVRTWQDTGLNCRRYRDFRSAALAAGLSLQRFRPVPVRGLTALTHLPALRDLFIFGVDCVARKPGHEAGA
jgi:SAM-dependent methyltransferase